MEENENTGNKRGETSLRLSETANQELTKLTKEWKASSKKEALEGMISYFKKLGISPLEEVPDTVGKRLEKRVDQIIAFIRQNEKIHREEIEKVLLFARQQQPDNPVAGNEIGQVITRVDEIRKSLSVLNENDRSLLEVQTAINNNIEQQNKMVTRRLIALKDPSALYQSIEKNLNLYADSVLANPQQVKQKTEKILEFLKALMRLTPAP